MLVFSKVFVGNLHVVKRPVSVAIGCWFLVIGSLSALVSSYLGRNDPALLAGMGHSVIPAEVQYAILLFSQGITLVADAGHAAKAAWRAHRVSGVGRDRHCVLPGDLAAQDARLAWRAHVRRHLRLAVQSEIECLVFATQGGQRCLHDASLSTVV